MKIQTIKTSTNIGELQGHDFKINISGSNQAVIMNLLSKGFYAKPKCSIIREYLSNAFDSHVEAKCEDKPIQVKIYQLNGESYISFDDFGVGLSPERVKDIFTSYFSSTKRHNDQEIGGFGLGSKSAYAYSNNFFVYTWYNNIKYSYLMTKNEHGVSRLEILGQEPSTRNNGTSVTLKMNNDVNMWKSHIANETCYFKNLYYDLGLESEFYNKTKIYKGKYFSYSSLSNRSTMHILLGQVPYALDFNALNINTIQCNLALNFEIGELQPTPNRESIILDENAKKLILDRLKLAASEIITLANSKNKETDDLEHFLASQNTTVIKFDTETVNISNLLEFSNIAYKKTSYKYLKSFTKTYFDKSKLYPRFNLNQKIKTRITTSNINYSQYLSKPYYRDIIIYSKDVESNSKINTHLSKKYNKDVYLLSLKNKQQFHLKHWIVFLSLKQYSNKLEANGKCTWRNLIEEYITFEQKKWHTYKKYKDVVPDPVARKTINRRVLDTDEISIYNLRRSYNHTGGTFENKVITWADIKAEIKPIIYGFHSQKPELSQLTPLMMNCKIITVAKKDIKNITALPNAVPYEDLKKHKELFNLITSWYIQDLMTEHPIFFKNRKFIKHANIPIVSDILNDLIAFNDKYHTSVNYSTFWKNLKLYVLDKNLLNQDIKSKCSLLTKHLDNFAFLDDLQSANGYSRSHQIDPKSYPLAIEILTKIKGYKI